MTTERQLELLNNLLKFAREAYINPEKLGDGKRMLENVFKNVLEGLDPHSTYLNAEEYKNTKKTARSEFSGIGVNIRLSDDKRIQIDLPTEGSPAETAGLKAKDIILKIDGDSTSGMSVEKAVEKIRGEANTPVTLQILREGENKPVDVTVTRGVIKSPGLKSTVIGDIGYVRIMSFFKDGIAQQFEDAVNDMEQKTGGKLSGYVMDLRDNPGGYVNDATKIADAVLDLESDHFITYTRGNRNAGNKNENPDTCNPLRRGGYDEDHCATPGDLTNGKPMFVIVNGGSASASELVSGALQDYKRATILGTQTFGKGVTQRIFPIDNTAFAPELAGGAIKLTVSRYFSPGGGSPQNIGITPDILYTPLDGMEQKTYTKESDFPNSVSNPHGTAAQTKSVATCSPAPDKEKEKSLDKIFTNEAGKIDYELLCAVETLRGKQNLTVTKPVPGLK